MERLGSTFEFGGETNGEEDASSREKKKRAAEKLRELAEKKAAEEKAKKEETKKPRKIAWLKAAEEKDDEGDEKPKPHQAEGSQEKTLEERKQAFLKEKTAQESIALREKIENSAPGSLESAQAQAELDVNAAIAQRLENPDEEADAVIEAEFDRRMEEITEADLENFEQAENNTIKTPAEDAEETLADDQEESEDPDEDAPDHTQPAATHATNQTTQKAASKPVGSPTPINQPLTPPPSSPINPTITVPQPLPIRNPVPTPSPAPSPGGGGGYNAPPPTHNNTLSPVGVPSPNQYNAPTPTSTTESASKKSEKRSGSGSVLAGALLGYAVGRRGGRKRTEAKLEPKVRESQNELAQTKREFSARQAELRSAIAARRQETAGARPSEATPTPPTVLESVSKKRQQAPSETKPAFSTAESPPDTRAETPFPATSHEFGHEAKPKPVAERPTPAKKFEQLNTQEIIREAESLHIDGVSVKSLYETNQIDRAGLIRIVRESMSGGDIKTAFKNVRLGRERQLERAHEFKHGDGGFTSTADDSTIAPQQPHQQASAHVASVALQAQKAAAEAIAAQPTLPGQPNPSDITPLKAEDAPLNTPSADSEKKHPQQMPVVPLILFVVGILLITLWLISNI